MKAQLRVRFSSTVKDTKFEYDWDPKPFEDFNNVSLAPKSVRLNQHLHVAVATKHTASCGYERLD